ncbi:MAG: hypothetical protein ABIZ72_09870, partial [Candidatus Limnocylindrales bacterium]
MFRRGLRASVVLVALVLVVGVPAEVALARLSDSAASTKVISTDTLDPPTSLAAIGGSTAALSWTATTDTYATGY